MGTRDPRADGAGRARDLVLNVNDTESARYLVSRILTHAGFEVIEAVNAQQGLHLARERKPNLVVLDVQLPDQDGREVARRLKADAETQSVAILLTSATFVSSDNKVAGLESGADAYLTQPFESIELVALVQALLRSKRHEAESRRRAAELAEAAARKDEFLAMLGHELRNPLSVIMSATALLADRGGAQDARITETITRQTKHLAALVDDLLDVSRINEGKITLKKERLDFAAMVRAAVASSKQFLDSRHHVLELQLPPSPILVDADPTRVEQIIVNVLTNAAKYTANHGTIALKLTHTQHADGTPIATLTVRDNGIGIDPAKLDSVFDLFYQVDGKSLARTSGGLGIGLTMVRRLTELHGGHARVDSKGLGHGTEVTLEFPAAEAAEAPMGESEAAPAVSGTAAAALRVLVVDDNVDASELVKLTLEFSGHSADTAPDGEIGLRMAVEGNYDAVVLDIGLPVLDGYEVAHAIREQMADRRPYLIALSGYGREEDRERSRAAGFDVHLVKPVDTALLDQALRRSTEHRHGNSPAGAPHPTTGAATILGRGNAA